MSANEAQFIKTGIVSSVDRKTCTARVIFEDCDESVSPPLPVVMQHTQNRKNYWLPAVGESVLCMFLPNGEESGFIIGSYYSEVDQPPEEIANEGKDQTGIWFEDGSVIKYDADEKILTLDIKGEIFIRATGDINILPNGG